MTNASTVNERGQITFASAAKLADSVRREYCRDSIDWMGGESREDYFRKARTGDASFVGRAEKLLDKIEVQAEREGLVWQNTVAGAYPDVPAFLANDPDCMRRRVAVETERAPLRVWVDVSSSCSITAEQLLPRGIAALALVMQLIRSGRAVELWTFTSLAGARAGQTAVCVRMATTPVDIASVAYCLTSQGFARGLCYAAGRQFNAFNGKWGRNYVKHGTLAERVAGARKTLQGIAEPQDIILPAPFAQDAHDAGDAGLIFRDPVRWVMETCKRAEDGEVQP